VQAVGELDQDDAHVLRHREQHLAEILRLRFLARGELDLVELRHAVDHVGDGLAERGLDLGLGDRRVLGHIVQQRRGEPVRVEAPLRQDARHRERVRDVRLARLAELAAVRGLGELERALDERDVGRRQVVAEMSGELRDLGHAVATASALALEQHLDADLAGGDFAQRDHGGLVAIGVEHRCGPGGDLPGAVGRRERELEAVGNPGEAVFDRDAGHGGLP
jgi:hypothetical protein